ncbi:cupin 2 barrel domain-containing protein [Alicycliphilus sp. B1]|nr:cupin 2 barrel domain-containing protein [Alicycliphilus sp. B1]
MPPIGKTVKGFDLTSWNGIFGPAGLPPAVVQRLNTELQAVLADKDLQDKLAQIGFQVWPSKTPRNSPIRGRQLTHWRTLIQQAGIQPNEARERHMTTSRYLVRAADVPSYQPPTTPHAQPAPDRPRDRGAKQMEVLLGTLHKGGGALPHAHPGIEQACYLLEGTARAQVEDEAFDMVPGDMCFFPADKMHVFTVTSDQPVKLLVIYSPPYGESPDKVIRP